MEMVGKEDLLSRCDFISLNCDLNSSSYHMIGEAELGQMKSTSYLINAARGPRIDERALVWALQNGKLAGAALSVFRSEPRSKASHWREF